MFSPKGADLKRGWPGRVDGDRVVQLAAQTLQSFFAGGGKSREHAEYALDAVDLRPPVLYPPAVRDFYAFEQHVAAARAARGLEVPPEWYGQPVFYFSTPAAIVGPGDEIAFPATSSAWDYEREVAAVVGAEGRIGWLRVMHDLQWSEDLRRVQACTGFARIRVHATVYALRLRFIPRDQSASLVDGDVGRVDVRRGDCGGVPRPGETRMPLRSPSGP